MLFRHAKSDWFAPYNTDYERKLSKRGYNAAKKMGKFVANKNEVPELIIASSAKRAKQTAKLAMKAGKWNSKFVLNRDIYFKGFSYLNNTLLNILQV